MVVKCIHEGEDNSYTDDDIDNGENFTRIGFGSKVTKSDGR